jgi:hypothetical protein
MINCRGLIMEIKDQGQKEHLRRLVPEWVLSALTVLWCGVLKEVGHKTLDIVIVAEIDKRVVAMAFLHVDEVNDPDYIAHFLQQITGVPQ